MKTTAAAKILSHLSYLAANRGSDEATLDYVAMARRAFTNNDAALARDYFRRAVRAWEVSTGWTLKRGELAAYAAAA